MEFTQIVGKAKEKIVRVAILISFAALGMTFCGARADTALVRVGLDSINGYIVPESYATDHKADILASVPGYVKFGGFWTPSEADVIVADRVLRNLIHDAAKDPSILFPDLVPPADDSKKKAPVDDSDSPDSLSHEQHELARVSDNYASYVRQYVGIIIDQQKFIFCNYCDGTTLNPAEDYIYIHKVFSPDGSVRFLQARFDPEAKTCSNVAMIGTWPSPGK